MPPKIILSAFIASLVGIVDTAACNSGPSVKTTEDKAAVSNSTSAAKVVTSSASNAPGLDLNCVFDHIQNPPESFHYSYQKVGSNNVDEEADITPQTIDGSFKNNDGAQPLHGVHSDSSGWQGAWSGLMGISGISSTIECVSQPECAARKTCCFPYTVKRFGCS